MSALSRIGRALERSGERPFLPSILKTVEFVARTGARNALVGRRFRIIGAGRMTFPREARLRFGTGFFGFMDGRERGLLRNRGQLTFDGPVSIGAGGRWDIGPEAIVTVGADTYFSPNTLLVASSQIHIGKRCAIGWDVQILDADFHSHGPIGTLDESESAKFFRAPVEIGQHVWIGSGARIYKGVKIGDGCIVAGGTVVAKSFTEPNALIGGSPARVLKSGVEWR